MSIDRLMVRNALAAARSTEAVLFSCRNVVIAKVDGNPDRGATADELGQIIETPVVHEMASLP